MTYSYNQPQPGWTDPQHAIPPGLHHVIPPQKRGPSAALNIAVLALLCAFGVAAFVALNPHTVKPADLSGLRGQITTLQHQVSTLNRQTAADAATIRTQTAALAALSKTVDGISATVKDLAPFAANVCSGPFTGSKGAFTASVPCKLLPGQRETPGGPHSCRGSLLES